MSFGYITLEDVRDYVQDRTLEDNELQLDLTFSDDEIMSAMRRAARSFNSLPPFVASISPDELPGDTNMFLDGTAYHLYVSRLAKLTRNDMDYTAGNVTTNIVQKQIGHLKELLKFHKDNFERDATALKISINVYNAFGKIG